MHICSCNHCVGLFDGCDAEYHGSILRVAGSHGGFFDSVTLSSFYWFELSRFWNMIGHINLCVGWFDIQFALLVLC